MAAVAHLTPRELAERWGVSVKTLTNHRALGLGPAYIKLGAGRTSPVRYRLEVVRKWEREHNVIPANPA